MAKDRIQGTRSVSMSVATINTGTYIFYFSVETNKLHFCLSDGNRDTVVKIDGEPIIANNGNTRLAAVPCSGTEFRVYYEDDKSYLAELVGVPEPGGGFTWSRWNPEMQDGKPLQIMKKSTIAATSVGLLRVFLVAPGGEVIQAYCDSDGWHSVLVNGGD